MIKFWNHIFRGPWVRILNAIKLLSLIFRFKDSKLTGHWVQIEFLCCYGHFTSKAIIHLRTDKYLPWLHFVFRRDPLRSSRARCAAWSSSRPCSASRRWSTTSASPSTSWASTKLPATQTPTRRSRLIRTKKDKRSHFGKAEIVRKIVRVYPSKLIQPVCGQSLWRCWILFSQLAASLTRPQYS